MISGHENWNMDELCHELMSMSSVDNSDLIGAICILARKVDVLEARIEKADRIARKAANDASCHANGIIPD